MEPIFIKPLLQFGAKIQDDVSVFIGQEIELKFRNGIIEIHTDDQQISTVPDELIDVINHFPADRAYIKGVLPGPNKILIELIKETRN